MKKQFLILFAFISVLALSQVPQRFNKVIVTGDITSPKLIKTGSNADSVLLGNGSARAISAIKTDTVSLSNRINAKAAGSGTANGTNTGDETLTSIKTKLGAATPVSDGYLKYQDFADFSDRVSNATHTGDATGSTALTLATVNSNVGTYNNITINAKGLATAGSNVSYEPSFSKNTGFNKNFGTTTGTVLEGRTFGTAANSAVGDFQPIENQRLSTINSPSFSSITSTVATGTSPFSVNSTTLVTNLNAQYLGLVDNSGADRQPNYYNVNKITPFWSTDVLTGGAYSYASGITVRAEANRNTWQLYGGNSESGEFEEWYFREGISTFGTPKRIYHSGNLTSSLSTNYIPKWNGSSFVKSLISDDGSNVGIGTTTRDNGKLVILKNSVYNSYTGAGLSIQSNTANAYTELQLGADDNVNIGYIQTLQKNTSYLTRSLSLNPNGGNVQIGYGVDQGYKLAVNGTGRFSSSVTAASFIGSGANLTGVQPPITLTTNGTSGAATFSGNVLNVPNYTSSGSFIQNQTTSAQTGGLWVSGIIQTNNTLYAAAVASHHVDVDEINITIAGTSGNATFIQPFRGIAYKKVIINLSGFVGNVNWSYPTAFTNTPVILMTDGLASTLITSKSTTSVTVTSATATTGILILEGY